MAAENKKDSGNGSDKPSIVGRADAERAISTVVGFLMVTALLGISVSKFASGEFSDLSEVFNSSKRFLNPDYIVVAFVILHHLRLWMGINFVMVDESFGAAITSAYKEDEPKIRKKELRLRIQLMLSWAAFPIWLNGYFGIWGLVVALIFQSYLLIRYNVLFFDAMYRKDKQRAANIFIAVGDGIIVIFSVFLLAFIVLNHNAPSIDAYAATVFAIVFGGLVSVFVGECISQYVPALTKLTRQLLNAIS